MAFYLMAVTMMVVMMMFFSGAQSPGLPLPYTRHRHPAIQIVTCTRRVIRWAAGA
jgi:hypothetical protein